MDHGIEDPQTREKNGKDPNGTIRLKASHQEGYVIVEIEDDGKGIDAKTVFDSAVKKELINPSDELSEQEIFQLLFAWFVLFNCYPIHSSDVYYKYCQSRFN